MSRRDEWLAQTFVELADTLVSDFDLVEFLSLLTERCGLVLGDVDVGLMLVDASGSARLMASSNERMVVVELFEIQSDEGPCIDTYRTGQPHVNIDLEAVDQRWPDMAVKARAAGYRRTHALPMRLRDRVIGAVNILDQADRELDLADLAVAQSMADVATIGILQRWAIEQATELAQQLQAALNSRVVIEQAKGIVAENLGLSIPDAFEVLRRHARDNSRQLGDVADDVITGNLPAAALVRR